MKHTDTSRRSSGALARFLRRMLLVVLTLALLCAGCAAMVLEQAFRGPSPAARNDLTALCHQQGLDWIPVLFLGEEAVADILAGQDRAA